MAQQSSIARLSGTYRTAGAYRGQTGTPWLTSTDRRLFLGGWRTGPSRPSRWLSAASTSATPLVREAHDRISRSTRRLTGVGRRDLDAEFSRSRAS